MSSKQRPQNHVFSCLTSILHAYSRLDINKLASGSLAIEILTQINLQLLDTNSLGLTASEKAILSRVWSCYRSNSIFYGCNQKSKLTMFLIHHQSRFQPSLSSLSQALLKSIPNCLIVSTQMTQCNNFLSLAQSKCSPFAVLFPSQLPTPTDMDRYLDMANVFLGHLHLQVCMYQACDRFQPFQAQTKHNGITLNQSEFSEKAYHREQIISMQALLLTSLNLDQQDHLDIFLREEIPSNSYINVLKERASRITTRELEQAHDVSVVRIGDKSRRILWLGEGQNQLLCWAVIEGVPAKYFLPSVLMGPSTKATSELKNVKQERHSFGMNQYLFPPIIDGLNNCSFSFSDFRKNRVEAQIQEQSDEEDSVQQDAHSTATIGIILLDAAQQADSLQSAVAVIVNKFCSRRKSLHQEHKVKCDKLAISKIASVLGIPEPSVLSLYLDRL